MNLAWWRRCMVAIAAGAGVPVPGRTMPARAASELSVQLYLVGDAGDPAPAGEPVLRALSHGLKTGAGSRVVLFLGDNIYPKGLPAPGHPDRKEAERRLAAQVQTITAAGATGYFIPGNHDWARHGKDGWAAARRQEKFIDSAGAGRVSLRPGGGCPGPSVVDVGPRLRLVLMDTQWWLHSGPKPRDPTSSCPADSELEIMDSLSSALRAAGERLVVVAAHHPLQSGGVHGGYFGWQDHIFPLRLVAPGLWIPLPLIGSLYPAARQNGISSQDVASRRYQRLIASFEHAFEQAPPALYAAGHEHNLQVIRGGAERLELVSGGGIYGHTGRAVPVRGTIFARNASGFARLDVPVSGPARLAVLEVDSLGGSREVFSTAVE